MNKEMFDKGLGIRRAVLGADYVDAQLKAADDFSRPFQEFITEYCWGAVWGRPCRRRRAACSTSPCSPC